MAKKAPRKRAALKTHQSFRCPPDLLEYLQAQESRTEAILEALRESSGLKRWKRRRRK